MKIFCIKKGHALYPAPESVEDLERIPQGKVVTVEVKRHRSVQHHRLFFSLIKIVWENCDHERYPTQDALRAALTISAGHRLEYQLPNGQAYFIAKSISFESMDQLAFNEFFERCCDAIAKYFMPGVTSEDLKRQICEMTGIAA